ncbi:MAG: hypothetical protein M1831_006177, partial [Alyxoria varia]
MRYTVILYLLLAAVTQTVYAGDNCRPPSPPKAICGQKCVDKVLDPNKPRSCKQGDFKCYCKKPDFGFAIRDCARQHCGKGK